MRLWRNRRGETVAENRREALDDTTRRWHRVEIMVEATAAEFDVFFDTIANGAFEAEPEGTDAHVSATSGVRSPSDDGMILTITKKGEPVDLQVEGLSLANHLVRGSARLDMSDSGRPLLDASLLIDRVEIGEPVMVEVASPYYDWLGGTLTQGTRLEPRGFGR